MQTNIIEQLNQYIPPEYIAFGLALTALSGSFYFIVGLVSPFIKWVQTQIYQLSYRQLETYVADNDYVKFNLWLEANKQYTYFQRAFKVINTGGTHHDDYDDIDDSPTSRGLVAGYGTVIIKAPGLPLISVTREKTESKQVYEQTETLRFRIFAFSEASVQRFYQEVNKMHVGGGPYVYTPSTYHWSNVGTLKHVLPPLGHTSKELIADVTTFLDSELKYKARGIPYKRGYMLYGQPGTGKSSVVAHLATTFNMNVYQLNTEGIMKFGSLRRGVKPRSIVLIEDVDMTVVGHSRTNTIGDNLDEDANQNGPVNISQEGLREFLNTLDGICEFSGSIVIITTNKPSALDPALIRPGRIDKKVEIGLYSSSEQGEHIERFFNKRLPVGFVDKLDARTVAELQDMCLRHMDDFDGILTELTPVK